MSPEDNDKRRGPKHHKYVSVNKHQRKKKATKRPRPLRNIHQLLDTIHYWLRTEYGRYMGFHIRSSCQGGIHYELGPGKVLFNDCNHRTFRFMRKTPHGYVFIRHGGRPKTFKR